MEHKHESYINRIFFIMMIILTIFGIYALYSISNYNHENPPNDSESTNTVIIHDSENEHFQHSD